MRSLFKRVAVIAGLACICSAQARIREDWKQFDSANGFSAMYPASWFRIGVSSENRLSILSSNGGAEGIVIKRGQAEIIAMQAEPANATLSQIIDHYAQGGTVLSRKDIHNTHAVKRSCGDLKEVILKEEAVPREDVPVPVPHIVSTLFFCEVREHRFVTILRNWEGDERQEHYRRIALQVARSFRPQTSIGRDN